MSNKFTVSTDFELIDDKYCNGCPFILLFLNGYSAQCQITLYQLYRDSEKVAHSKMYLRNSELCPAREV